jgi:hypothetical protein
MTEWTFAAYHVLRDTLFHQRVLRIGEGLQNIALGTSKGAL